MNDSAEKRKSFKVTKGHTHLTVYPHRDGWRFAWRTNEMAKWKYVTRAKKVEAKAAAENMIDQMGLGGLDWNSLPFENRCFLEKVHSEVRREDWAAVLKFIESRKKSAEVSESVDKYLKWKIQEAGEKTPHLGNIEGHLKPMAKHFAKKSVVDITAEELKKWWTKQWGHLGWKTRKGTRSSLVGFWKWCIFQKIYPKEVTPAEQIPPVKTGKCERRVLTPDEFTDLAAAILPQYRASIVLQAFCGLRPEEVTPANKKGGKKKSKRGIRREEIDWEENVIRIADDVAKTGYSRILPLLPTAREWLEWAGVGPGQCGPICEENLAEVGETKRLGVEVFKTGWPKDALRHSYGSYRNAIIRSLPQVAEEMGSSVTMLQKHYHNPRSAAEGEAWFALRPPESIRQTSE